MPSSAVVSGFSQNPLPTSRSADRWPAPRLGRRDRWKFGLTLAGLSILSPSC
jgi:hypothetical protein